MKRRAFLGAVTVGCGDEMMRRSGSRFDCVRACSVPEPKWSNDLRVGPGSDKLAFWHRAEHGITLSSAMYGTGATPGAITLGGDLTSAQPVYVDIATAGQVGGTLVVHVALDENGANRVLENYSVTSAVVAIPGSSKTLTFTEAFTYDADEIHRAAVAQWEPLFGATGTAGGRLDNSTVAASPGNVYEAHGLNETRASVLMAPAMLGNQGTLGSAVAGNATPFHLFYVAEVTTLPSTTAVLALFGWLSQTVAGSHVIDWIITGTATTNPPNPPSTHGIQRINSTPTTQRYNSDGITGGLPVANPDLAPHVYEIEYDGATMTARIDGFDVATGVWSGTVTSNRFCIGGVKSGGGVATAFLSHRTSDIAVYLPNLGADAVSVRARLA